MDETQRPRPSNHNNLVIPIQAALGIPSAGALVEASKQLTHELSGISNKSSIIFVSVLRPGGPGHDFCR